MGRLGLRMAAGVGICLAAFASPSGADTRLDQINEVYIASGPGAHAGTSLAQTFTVGITGTLAYVDMWLWDAGGPATADLLVEIWSTDGGLPQSGPLARVTLTPDDVQDSNVRRYTRTDFRSAGLAVTAGEVLAIVLRTEAVADHYAYIWWGNEAPADGGYTRGNGFQSIDGEVTWQQIMAPDWDFMFRTFVDVTPDTLLAELLAGVIGVGPGQILERTVAGAQVYYTVPDIQATCSVLRLFDFEVRTIWRLSVATRRSAPWKITTEQMDDLLGQSGSIQIAIGCN